MTQPQSGQALGDPDGSFANTGWGDYFSSHTIMGGVGVLISNHNAEWSLSFSVVVTRVDYSMSRSKSIKSFTVGNRGRVHPMHMLVDIFHAMGVG